MMSGPYDEGLSIAEVAAAHLMVATSMIESLQGEAMGVNRIDIDTDLNRILGGLKRAKDDVIRFGIAIKEESST
ncbi:MAG: hypothetical protein V3S43_06480 [Acidimicrobiia bacterium]